jgi:hypothetical protein
MPDPAQQACAQTLTRCSGLHCPPARLTQWYSKGGRKLKALLISAPAAVRRPQQRPAWGRGHELPSAPVCSTASAAKTLHTAGAQLPTLCGDAVHAPHNAHTSRKLVLTHNHASLALTDPTAAETTP